MPNKKTTRGGRRMNFMFYFGVLLMSGSMFAGFYLGFIGLQIDPIIYVLTIFGFLVFATGVYTEPLNWMKKEVRQ